MVVAEGGWGVKGGKEKEKGVEEGEGELKLENLILRGL